MHKTHPETIKTPFLILDIKNLIKLSTTILQTLSIRAGSNPKFHKHTETSNTLNNTDDNDRPLNVLAATTDPPTYYERRTLLSEKRPPIHFPDAAR